MNVPKLKEGYHELTAMETLHPHMLMDIGVYCLSPGETLTFHEKNKETALLLLDGTVTFSWEEKSYTAQRTSVFDQSPTCLHFSKDTPVTLTADGATEVLIEKTTNDRTFPPVLYKEEDVSDTILGEGTMQNAARRVLRDIFNYDNAPYSNMVLGEVITLPGRWSSYPPHHHDQPEVYYHRFDKPQGFGASFIGDQPIKISHHSVSIIPGGEVHPQVSAPGYAMYYAWMIRHLQDNPWTQRVDDPDHTWLYDKDAIIWEVDK